MNDNEWKDFKQLVLAAAAIIAVGVAVFALIKPHLDRQTREQIEMSETAAIGG